MKKKATGGEKRKEIREKEKGKNRRKWEKGKREGVEGPLRKNRKEEEGGCKKARGRNRKS